MRIPNFIKMNELYGREEDFNRDLAKDLNVLGVGSFVEGETEASVGTRFADIVAQGDGEVLVVECQFGRADWDHWGRLEAYARLKEASTAVLVAENFEDLMVVTCELRNADSNIGWYLVKALATERREVIFQVMEGPKTDIQMERSGREYSKFWAPIRASGKFAGKPVPEGESWISKSVRGIEVQLFANKEFSTVKVVWPIDRVEERDAFAQRMEYPNVRTHETRKKAVIQIPVMDKGLQDSDHWDDIRKRLIETGEKVLNMVSESSD